MQASYELTDLAALTTELASVFRSAIERAGMTLAVNCEKMDGPFYVDRDMWEKIVMNLLSNAFKYTLQGGIAVTLGTRDRNVELAVKDTGVGIPERELPNLFQRFHRIEGTQGRTHEGTGIGLALVQELVKLHGGTVRVQSTEGKGSTFTVSIPPGKAHLPPERIRAERSLASTAIGTDAYVDEALRWLPPKPSRAAAKTVEPASIGSSGHMSAARVLASCWPMTMPICADTSSGFWWRGALPLRPSVMEKPPWRRCAGNRRTWFSPT